MRLMRAGVAVVMVLFAGACSGGEPTPAGDGSGPRALKAPKSLCASLGDEDFRAAFGETVRETEGQNISCTWTLSDGRMVIALALEYPVTAREYFDNTRNPDGEPVAGLGEEAVWTPLSGRLYVLVPGLVLDFRVTKPQSEDGDPEKKDAARTLVARLIAKL